MRISRRGLVFVALAIPPIWRDWTRVSFAQENSPLNVDRDHIAIRGYDPVAYFTMSTAVKGDPHFEYDWRGARWFFANELHREMFIERPESYAPQFGGFCAMAMSQGMHVAADPHAWIIVNGQLYLNGTPLTQDDRNQYSAGVVIEKAKENWQKIAE